MAKYGLSGDSKAPSSGAISAGGAITRADKAAAKRATAKKAVYSRSDEGLAKTKRRLNRRIKAGDKAGAARTKAALDKRLGNSHRLVKKQKGPGQGTAWKLQKRDATGKWA